MMESNHSSASLQQVMKISLALWIIAAVTIALCVFCANSSDVFPARRGHNEDHHDGRVEEKHSFDKALDYHQHTSLPYLEARAQLRLGMSPEAQDPPPARHYNGGEVANHDSQKHYNADHNSSAVHHYGHETPIIKNAGYLNKQVGIVRNARNSRGNFHGVGTPLLESRKIATAVERSYLGFVRGLSLLST